MGECPPGHRAEQGPARLAGSGRLHTRLMAFALCEIRSYRGGWTEKGYALINAVMGSKVMLATGRAKPAEGQGKKQGDQSGH